MKPFSKNQNKMENEVKQYDNMAIFELMFTFFKNIDIAEADFSDRCYQVVGQTRAVRLRIDPFKPFSTAVFA